MSNKLKKKKEFITVEELKKICKIYGIKGYGRLKKKDLINLMCSSLEINNLNEYFHNQSKMAFNQLSKKDKKKFGIFFTPEAIVKKAWELLRKYELKLDNVLEPSSGSCNLLKPIFNKDNINITCVELNKVIYRTLKIKKNENFFIFNQDFLKFRTEKKFDLIIGNPPYKVVRKNKVDIEYHQYFTGRPNIFALFLIKSLKLLNKNGILCFVLPLNFQNCSYYNKLRFFLVANYQILDVVDCSSETFSETKQATLILILKNQSEVNNKDFIFTRNNSINIFPREKVLILNDLIKGSTTLHDLGFTVSTGNVVWNQHKQKLTDFATNSHSTRLIYNFNIKNNELFFENKKHMTKKPFLSKLGNNKMLLVVNRGSQGGKYQFNFCLIDVKYAYLLENHLLSIDFVNNLSKAKRLFLFKKIIKSFQKTKTKVFLDTYLGTSTLNCTELKHILPIYIQ